MSEDWNDSWDFLKFHTYIVIRVFFFGYNNEEVTAKAA